MIEVSGLPEVGPCWREAGRSSPPAAFGIGMPAMIGRSASMSPLRENCRAVFSPRHCMAKEKLAVAQEHARVRKQVAELEHRPHAARSSCS